MLAFTFYKRKEMLQVGLRPFCVNKICRLLYQGNPSLAQPPCKYPHNTRITFPVFSMDPFSYSSVRHHRYDFQA